MTCRDCHFYFPETENTQTRVSTGECRRFPPQVVQTLDVSEIMQDFAWPLVRDTSWCGEFEERDEEWKTEPN